MQVSELMTADPIVVSSDDSIVTAIDLMHEHNIRHLPVIDDEGTLVGMLSDRDARSVYLPYLREPEAPEGGRRRLGEPVLTFMTSPPIAVDIESDASLAAEMMIEHRVGSLPVVDADGALVGILSYVDLLRHYARLSAD